MNAQSTETRTSFNQVWEKSDLETAVMVFQDKTPKSTKETFDIYQWTVVLKSASSKSKIKKEAWENIKRLAKELNFSKAGEIFVDNSYNERLKLLMLNVMCSSAKTPHNINYCIGVLDDNDERVSDLLEKLSKADGLFIDWTAVFLDSKNADVQKEAFVKTEKAKATFEEWETFDTECRRSYRGSYCKSYLSQRFAEMRKRADTFRKKFAVYNAFHEEKLLAAEILKDMENTAEKPSNLVWVYERTKSESVKKKILTAQDTFSGWLYVNQGNEEDWLKELSLKRMKEMAKDHYHWSTIWCRESSEWGKIKAVSSYDRNVKGCIRSQINLFQSIGYSLRRKSTEKAWRNSFGLVIHIGPCRIQGLFLFQKNSVK